MEGYKYLVENKGITTKKNIIGAGGESIATRHNHLNQLQRSFITSLNKVNQPSK